jgi:hypothetical protein
MQMVGNEGVIRFEEAKGLETELEIVEGSRSFSNSGKLSRTKTV